MSRCLRLSLHLALVPHVAGIVGVHFPVLGDEGDSGEANVSDTIANGYSMCRPNERSDLVPPKGTMWMGGVMSDKEHWPRLFEKAGLSTPPMQIFRMYTDLPKIASWKDDYPRAQIEEATMRGDIVWFDVTPYDWALCAKGGCDEQFITLAEVLVSIQPAQAFVSLGHEVDHSWTGVEGTDEEFVTMWQRAHEVVKKNGGSNAVWKYVVSNQVWDDHHIYENCWMQMLNRWPGDKYVDWFGHNLYMKHAEDHGDGTATYVYGETFFRTKRGNSVNYVLDTIHKKLKEASKNNRNFLQKPWALSTVGVHDSSYSVPYNDVLGNENLGVPKEFRVEFFSELKEALKSADRYKMFAYFDHDDCKLDSVTLKPFHSFAATHVFDGC